MPEKLAIINKIAEQLDHALHHQQTIDPLKSIHPDLGIPDAYQIQLVNVKRELDRGARITGKKIGLTAQVMQDLFKVNEPDYGHLMEHMLVSGGEAKADLLIQPKVEGEIAFMLKDDLWGPNLTIADVMAATEYVVGAIEIVDSRISDWKIGLLDTVADNASSAMYVLGEKKLRPEQLLLSAETMELYKNGNFINAGSGTDVMTDPAACVAWLGNKLSEYGVGLKKGEIVLSGAISAAVPAAKGDHFHVVFNHLGRVDVKFV